VNEWLGERVRSVVEGWGLATSNSPCAMSSEDFVREGLGALGLCANVAQVRKVVGDLDKCEGDLDYMARVFVWSLATVGL
jgi:hypothetical protein